MGMVFGRLPSEVRERITAWDFQKYLDYREKYGPISPVRMYDRGPAIVSATVLRANGSTTIKATDFLPYGQPPDEPIYDETE